MNPNNEVVQATYENFDFEAPLNCTSGGPYSVSCANCPPLPGNQAWVVKNLNDFFAITITCGTTQNIVYAGFCASVSCGLPQSIVSCSANINVWQKMAANEIEIAAGSASGCQPGEAIAIDGGVGSSVWPSTINLDYTGYEQPSGLDSTFN